MPARATSRWWTRTPGATTWRAASARRASPFRVYNDEVRIVGSMAVLHSFERALALFAKGVIDSEKMITDRFSLADYSRAIDAFLSGKGLKVQVAPGMI